MSTAIPLALTWADIRAMPRGARRDELAYAYRTRTRARRETQAALRTESAQIRHDAELERQLAIFTHCDTEAEQAARCITLDRRTPRP